MHDAGLSVVVPLNNGSDTLPELVGRIDKTLEDFCDYEIILVDDSSSDNSFKVITSITNISDNVAGTLLDRIYCQQSAILCGLMYSPMEFSGIMDDDLENGPEDIPSIFSP